MIIDYDINSYFRLVEFIISVVKWVTFIIHVFFHSIIDKLNIVWNVMMASSSSGTITNTANELLQAELLSLNQHYLVITSEKIIQSLLTTKFIAENIKSNAVHYNIRLENYMKSHWFLAKVLNYWNNPSKYVYLNKTK